MGKPVERQNHSLSFFILSALIAISTAWAFYEEFLDRRPWKQYEQRIFGYERQKAEQDARYFQRKIEAGDIKVAINPAKPDEKITVAEAKKRLEEFNRNLAKQQDEINKLKNQVHDAQIEANDADLKVKYLRSDDDGLFYLLQHATHEEALAQTDARTVEAEGKKSEAEAARKRADAHREEREQVEKERAAKAQEIKEAEGKADQASKRLAQIQANYDAKVGEGERLKSAIEAAEDPIRTAKTAAEAAAKKGPELTQYWLTTYDNSVDRCQNCHTTVDKCGFSRPHEIVDALNAPDAKPAEVGQKFCVNPEILDHYKQVATDVCALDIDRAASEKGQIATGECFKQPERVQEFLKNHCGEASPVLRALSEKKYQRLCFEGNAGKTLAAYLQEPSESGACQIQLKGEGETCLAGAQRDLLQQWVANRCPETSPLVTGLKKFARACASGPEAQKLSGVKPVLYEYPIWAQSHPYRSELLGSNHPADKFGCTSCHEGQGAQTKGVAGREFHHGHDDPYWEKPMLDLVAYKKFRPRIWGPPPANEGVPGEWVQNQKYLVDSSCAKCHVDEVHLKFADTYTRGRRLVSEIGCHGCHPIDVFNTAPKIGPILTDLKKKTTPAFLTTWISYPKSFRRRTKMPNFWPEALDEHLRVRQGSAEAATRRQEVEAIASYLWKSSTPNDLPAIPVAGNAERGRALSHQVGCRGCHALVPVEKLCTAEQIAQSKGRGTPDQPGECEGARSLSGSDARDFAPNLANIGLKANDRWLFAWLKNPSAMWAATRMPNLRLSDQEAADLTAYLLTLKQGPGLGSAPQLAEGSPQFQKNVEEGSRLITKYGCAGCHDIRGHENDSKIGADLSEFGRKAVDLLDYGNAIPNPRHHTWYNWADLKLRAPRSYRYERVETRMPQFDLNDDEVKSVLTFLRSRTGDKVPAAYLVSKNERLLSMAQGDQLMEYFNCKGCHTIDFEGGLVRDSYLEDDLYKAPPILQQEGWRVQPEWLFAFLRDPSQKLRPWLDIRMPTFPLGDDRRTTLVRSFAARSNVSYPYLSVKVETPRPKELQEVKAMVDEQLNCFKCHTAGEAPPDQDKASLAPNLELAKQRLRPDWVEAWLRNPQSLQEGTRMPNFFTPDNPESVMYPNYFGGSQEKQIKALRDYVMTLPDTPPGKPQATLTRTPKKKH